MNKYKGVKRNHQNIVVLIHIEREFFTIILRSYLASSEYMSYYTK